MSWTIDDLQDTPDDGNRYEIVDGSLLATPPPNGSHVRVNTFVRNALLRGKPADLEVVDCAGDSPYPLTVDPAEIF